MGEMEHMGTWWGWQWWWQCRELSFQNLLRTLRGKLELHFLVWQSRLLVNKQTKKFACGEGEKKILFVSQHTLPWAHQITHQKASDKFDTKYTVWRGWPQTNSSYDSGCKQTDDFSHVGLIQEGASSPNVPTLNSVWEEGWEQSITKLLFGIGDSPTPRSILWEAALAISPSTSWFPPMGHSLLVFPLTGPAGEMTAWGKGNLRSSWRLPMSLMAAPTAGTGYGSGPNKSGSDSSSRWSQFHWLSTAQSKRWTKFNQLPSS